MAAAGMYSFGGWLCKMKKSHRVLLPQWNKRWFTIEGTVLRWYSSDPAASVQDAHGEVNLATIALQRFSSTTDYSFVINTPQRNLLLRASTAAEMEMWIRKLRMYADIARGGDGTGMVPIMNSADPERYNTDRLPPRLAKGGKLEQRMERALEELASLEAVVRSRSVFSFPFASVAACGSTSSELGASSPKRKLPPVSESNPYVAQPGGGAGVRLAGGIVYKGRSRGDGEDEDKGVRSKGSSDRLLSSTQAALSSLSSLSVGSKSSTDTASAARIDTGGSSNSSNSNKSKSRRGMGTGSTSQFDSVSEIDATERSILGHGTVVHGGGRSGKYAWV